MELSPYGTLYSFIATPLPSNQSVYSRTLYTLWPDGNLRYSDAVENVLPGLPGPDESLYVLRMILDSESKWIRSELLRIGPDGEGPEVVNAELPTSVQMAAVDEQNNIRVRGDVPVSPDARIRNCPGCDRIGMLDASRKLVFGTAMPFSASHLRLTNGVLYAGSSSAALGEPSIAIVDRSAPREPILASISDVDRRGLSLLPGNVIALSGASIGPEAEVYRPLDRNGRLATEVGGYRVLFDGRHAPIVSASRDRLVVQVPLTQPSPWSTLTIEQFGKPLIASPLMATLARGPIILAGVNPPDASRVIRIEDGTVNGADNPALLGTVVRFLVAGVGETNPPRVEGEVTHTVLSRLRSHPQ